MNMIQQLAAASIIGLVTTVVLLSQSLSALESRVDTESGYQKIMHEDIKRDLQYIRQGQDRILERLK